MKLSEIAERLKQEFPGVYVSFDVSAASHVRGDAEFRITIYHEATRTIDCTSLEDGIARVKAALNPPKPEDLDVDVSEVAGQGATESRSA